MRDVVIFIMNKLILKINFFKKTASIFFFLAFGSACGGGNNMTSLSQTNSVPIPPSQNPPTEMSTNMGTEFSEVSALSGMNVQFDTPLLSNQAVALIFPHGVASGDYDNDGDIDLFIAKADRSANHLFRNIGNMTFEDVALEAGVAFNRSDTETYYHGSPAFVDLNEDGNLDLLIPGLEQEPTLVFLSNGDETFTDVSAGTGLDEMSASYSHSPAFGDYDLDGDLDLFFGHWGTPRDFDNVGDTEHLWRNDSDETGVKFTSVSLEAGIAPVILTNEDPLITQRGFDYTFTPTFARVNEDSWPDILIVGDFGFSQVFINQKDGTFTNETDFEVIIDGNGMGSAVGDYDNDGDMDWFVSSILARLSEDSPERDQDQIPSTLSEIGNRLYRNNSGTFEDVTVEMGVDNGGWGWGSCFIDFENDGDLDLYHTNGWNLQEFGDFLNDESRAFISNEAGQFVNQAQDLGLNDMEQGRGIVCDDFDNDGDIDILQLHRNNLNAISLWQNDYDGPNGYLKVSLEGDAPNTQAIGARISVIADNTTYIRDINLGSNFASHNSTVQHFGLGSARSITSVIVNWPNGEETRLSSTSINQTITISQND